MSLSIRDQPIATQRIAGGFVLVPVRQLLFAWRACQHSPLGIGEFRTWLAAHEMLARRCSAGDGRSPSYGSAELARLTGVSQKTARGSVKRLVGAGLLVWSDQVIEFPDQKEPDDDPLDDSIGGGKGSLVIPRRILRFLADGARPALIATVLAILLRCLSRGRDGFKSRGRVKASWIARVFKVDLRRVKQARKELIDLGWIAPEPTEPWAENRWGRAYAIDLAWNRIAPPVGRRLPPPPPPAGRRLPPPDSDPEPLREEKDQKPASGGPAGFRIRQEVREQGPRPTLPMARGAGAPATPAETTAVPTPSVAPKLEPARPAPAPTGIGPGRPAATRSAVDGREAKGGPLGAPRLDDVRLEDLKDTGRLLLLLAQAIVRGLVGPSEADRLRFVGAAEHALAVGKENPAGLFLYLVRGRLWRYLTQEDEDRAHSRIKRELIGETLPGSGIGLGAGLGVPVVSADARLVGEVRAALIRAGIFRDPFDHFRRLNPDWTRARWDAALSELGLS